MLATILTAVLALGVATAAAQTTLTGRIVGISDGDTITLHETWRSKGQARINFYDGPYPVAVASTSITFRGTSSSARDRLVELNHRSGLRLEIVLIGVCPDAM